MSPSIRSCVGGKGEITMTYLALILRNILYRLLQCMFCGVEGHTVSLCVHIFFPAGESFSKSFVILALIMT